MTPSEQTLQNFETRVRQMILRFQELKNENAELYAMVEKNEQEIENLQAKLTQAGNDYDSLKMAKMLEITDGDLENVRERVNNLIQEVNKCIAILSDNEVKEED